MGLARRSEERRLHEAILSDNPDRGEVVIACSGSFAMLLYPHLLDVMQRAPHLIVRLEAMPQSSVVKGVLEGRVDLGVADQKPEHALLDAELLGHEELCLVLPADATSAPVSFSMLEELGFISHPDGNAYAEELFSLNSPTEFKGSERLRVQSFVNQIGQIPVPVAKGIGYTLLSRSGATSFPERHRLRIASLEHSRRYDLSLIFRRGRVLPKRVTGIADLIKSIARTLEIR